MYFHFLFCIVSSFASSSFYNVFIRYIPDAYICPRCPFSITFDCVSLRLCVIESVGVCVYVSVSVCGLCSGTGIHIIKAQKAIFK